jgi:hypothetical protein
MKARTQRVALNLAMVGLAVVALAAPAGARSLVRNGRNASNALITANGVCPSNFPCVSSEVTTFVGSRGTRISTRR